jgi:uncharacterized protein (UPF0332 family)
MAVAVAIDPRRLIEHARDLARQQSGAGRPRAASLRRAVSAAYYAAFHAVGLHVARQLLPHGTTEDQWRLTRSLDHGALREVCQWTTGNPGAGKQHVRAIVADLQADPDIRELAGVAFRLQEARHLADYDHLAPFSRPSVLSSINEAELVVDRLDALVGNPALEKLLALIALHSKLR